MTILLLHALATWTLVGLIWFVQMVHYPLFSLVTGETSPRYAAEHQRRTSWVVVPVDPEVIRRLVLTNGFRTGLWTARGAVAWLLLDGRIAT